MSQQNPSSVFSEQEQRTLAAVLDEIIPPNADRKMPGAGAIGVARFIEDTTLRQSPETLPIVQKGLAAADELAFSRKATPFAALSPKDRLDVLRELESTTPSFLSSLIFPTFLGYYQSPAVGIALGIGSDPPHPKGYSMEPFDLALLDSVRRRPKLYRGG